MLAKTIYIFGNEVIKEDSLPIKILPKLRQALPNIVFEIKDPNEEWDAPPELTIIDTVIGIKEVTVFNNLESFMTAPRFSMHDFDALANLRYMKKLGKIKEITVIGVPPYIGEKEALNVIKKIFSKA